MPKEPNPMCIECVKHARKVAKKIHGPVEEGGDGCWKPSCDRNRTHYRNRADNNAKQSQAYQVKKAKNSQGKFVESETFPVDVPPVAYLYLYQEDRPNAHLHAMSAAVWQGEEKLFQIEPIHCMGLKNRQIQAHLNEILQTLNKRYGIRQFWRDVRMDPRECPLSNCPLKEAPCPVNS